MYIVLRYIPPLLDSTSKELSLLASTSPDRLSPVKYYFDDIFSGYIDIAKAEDRSFARLHSSCTSISVLSSVLWTSLGFSS
jgi:hypothetical protein